MLPIETVSEFIFEVNGIKRENVASGEESDLMFRGQKSEYKLQPSIMRFGEAHIGELERLSLVEFKRVSLPFIQIQPKDDFDWIVLAQHFGQPTRLLDWTYNPLSALWFAVSEFKNRTLIDDGDCASVWIFSPSLSDYTKQQGFEGAALEIQENMIYTPRNLVSRVVNQSSVFTIHSLTNMVNLEDDPVFKYKLYQRLIKRGSEDSILKELNILNVNESTIYPDLGGLCRHLRWRYFEQGTKS